MATRLHTAFGDEIREVAKTDPIQAAEMRLESEGYRREIMGHFDEEIDPADMEDEGPETDNDDEPHCEECGSLLVRDECPNSRCPINDGNDEPDDGMTDVEADADALASAGMGTDEDYGDYGGHEDFGWDGGCED
jgi:hypothetical protein